MRFVLKVFFLCLAAGLAVVWLADNPGEARFLWLGFELETGMAAVLGFLLVMTALLASARGLWRRLRMAQTRFLQHRRERRKARLYGELLNHLAEAVEARSKDQPEAQSTAWQKAETALEGLWPQPEAKSRLAHLFLPPAPPPASATNSSAPKENGDNKTDPKNKIDDRPS